MIRPLGIALIAVLLAACQSAAVKPPPVIPESPGVLIHAIADDAKQSDLASDSKTREALAQDAVAKADACVGLAPDDAGCLYYDGLALGLEARAHPTRAPDTLKRMLKALDAADEKDPNYDGAGPSRVRALVLIRAPGWPVGPGDAEAGLAAAKKAVSLKADYPPNELALAEALAKNGDAVGAQEAYGRARALASALPQSPDRDDWIKQAELGLKHP